MMLYVGIFPVTFPISLAWCGVRKGCWGHPCDLLNELACIKSYQQVT